MEATAVTGGVSLGQPPTYAGSNLHHLAPSPPVVGPWPGEPMETLLQHRWCAFLCTCALVLIPSQSQGLPRASGGGPVHGSNNTSGGVLDDVRISKTTLYFAGGAVAVLVALCVLGWALLLCISVIYHRSTRQSAVRPRSPESVPLEIFHPRQLSPSHSSTCSTVSHLPTPTRTTVQSKRPHTNQFPFPISKSNLSAVLGSGKLVPARVSFSNPELAAVRLYRKLNPPVVNLDESVTSQTSQQESICRYPLCESARAHPPSATQSDPLLLSTSTATTPADSPGRLPSGWEHGANRPLSQ